MNSKPLPPGERSFSLPDGEKPQSLPHAAYFDSLADAWIISRFADVQAAFVEPGLCPVGAKSKDPVTAKDREVQARLRAEAMGALTAAKLAVWESDFASQARSIASALPTSRLVDVVAEFARPWALTVAVRVTGANERDAQHLAHLAAEVSALAASPDDLSLEATAGVAGAELDQVLKHGTVPMAGPAFVGLSQTLPCLLANLWHALLQYQAELELLHDNPELIPCALEELLRFAGLVNVLHRQAISDVELGGIRVKAGQRVRLLVGVALHDCAQFSSPDEMDITRRGTRHFAFGAGPHSCAAAPLLRMAAGTATRCFVEHFGAIEPPAPVNWNGGAGFRWPAPLYAARREN